MTAKCIGCSLCWNISAKAKIPPRGYTCPHCDSRMKAGETLKEIQASQKRRPSFTKGVNP